MGKIEGMGSGPQWPSDSSQIKGNQTQKSFKLSSEAKEQIEPPKPGHVKEWIDNLLKEIKDRFTSGSSGFQNLDKAQDFFKNISDMFQKNPELKQVLYNEMGSSKKTALDDFFKQVDKISSTQDPGRLEREIGKIGSDGQRHGIIGIITNLLE